MSRAHSFSSELNKNYCSYLHTLYIYTVTFFLLRLTTKHSNSSTGPWICWEFSRPASNSPNKPVCQSIAPLSSLSIHSSIVSGRIGRNSENAAKGGMIAVEGRKEQFRRVTRCWPRHTDRRRRRRHDKAWISVTMGGETNERPTLHSSSVAAVVVAFWEGEEEEEKCRVAVQFVIRIPCEGLTSGWPRRCSPPPQVAERLF